MDTILAFMIVNVFLILGMILREIIPIFKKLFIPAAIIGGVLLLICGPQVLNLFDISDSIKGYPGFLIIIILTCTVFGSKIDRSRIRSYADFTVVNAGLYGVQLACGVIVGIILSKIWTALPPNWGCVGVYTFWGGHGTGASAAKIYSEAGFEDFLGIAMVMATIGLCCAMIIGMAIINWGVRKGHTKYVDKPEKLSKEFYGGLLPADKRDPIGYTRTNSAGINAIALQMGLIAICIIIGWGLKEVLGAYVSPAFLQIDEIVNGIIGALILMPLMKVTKTEEYIDKKTISNISSFCMEYLVVAAVGTLRLETMATFVGPIVIYAIVVMVIVVVSSVLFSYKFHKDEWFEKMIMNFGQCSGSTATGLALLRCVDPKGESTVWEAEGISAAVFMPVYVTMIAAGPVMALASGGSMKLIGIGLALTVACVVLGVLFFRAKDHNNLFAKGE